MTIQQALERQGVETFDIGPDSARRPTDDPTPRGERLVSVDLDDADPFDLWRAWRTLEDAGGEDLEARVSSGGEGLHVRAWFDAEAVDVEDAERLRLSAGDHARRTQMDRTHVLKPSNVLFTRKGDREAGPWRSCPEAATGDLLRRSERFGPGRGWSP